MRKLSIILLAASIALTCEASQKQFKAQETHEKTIFVTDHPDTVFVQSETFTINAENYGSYEYCFTGKGFGVVQRYNDSSICRQFKYPSNGIYGQEWRYLITRNYNGISEVERFSINNKREIISKVPLQRTGTKNSETGKVDTKIIYRKLKKAGYTIYYQNDRSSIHPKVDSVLCMVRSSVLFVDNPLYRFSLN